VIPSLTASVVQLSSQDDVAKNLERVRAHVKKAAAHGATLVALPENFAYMGDDDGKRSIAEDLDAGGPIVTALREIARENSVHLFAGGMPERSTDPMRPFNTHAVFDPSGSLVARYRKMHLFDVDLADGTRLRESDATHAGAAPSTLDLNDVKIGLSVCYDLRFPELYRDLNARILLVPAAFTVTTGKDHWHVLLRARAIENQAFVIAAAQHGKHPRGRQTYGKSLVVDPWGDVLAQCAEGEGFALATLDFAAQDRVRAALPALKHRVL